MKASWIFRGGPIVTVDRHDTIAAALAIGGGQRGKQQAQDVQIEHLVEVLNGDVFQGREFINAGVIDQNVDFVENFLRLGE